MLPEGGWTHVRPIRQVVHTQRLNEVLLQPGDGPRNLLARGPGKDEMPELRAVRTCQKADSDFLLDQGRQPADAGCDSSASDQACPGRDPPKENPVPLDSANLLRRPVPMSQT